MNFTIQQASAKIVVLINSRPESPRQDEIEAILAQMVGPVVGSLSEEKSNLHAAVDEYVAAEKAYRAADLANLHTRHPQQHAAIQARHGVALDRLSELADQLLPTPAPSPSDVILLARVVYCYDDKNDDGDLRNLEHDCIDERMRALLVQAVLDLAGIRYRY